VPLAFIGFWEFLILIAVIALAFGSARFVRTGRALGRGAKELKRELKRGDAPPRSEPDRPD